MGDTVKVLAMDQYRSLDTIVTLEALLAEARKGELRGIIFCAKFGHRRHDVGATGEYVADPILGIGAAATLIDALRRKHSQQ